MAAVDHVDWVNVMSYDLHGVWDATNPIGNTVLSHTNLTEIKLALDLFWRNSIPANKLNLGVGFYGRSFQLSDPSCSQPGCQFKGGALPGPCTANSGTLAYFEIMDLISQKNLSPYYDKEAQAKYVVWDNDQWVSYDDADTFQAKIDFANNLGLGGLLIWSIDQDTQNLDALKAVLGSKGIDAFKDTAADAAYWQQIGAQDCYTTDCGGSCKTGFITTTHQPCGSAKFLTRHSTKKDSALCCPVAAAPNSDDCTWRGSAPSCNGHCSDGEVTLELNRWGDGDYCEDGNKAYCCKNEGVENTCYWTGVGGNCNSGDEPLTFAGTFLETVADIASFGGLFGEALADILDGIDMDLRKLYCCPPDMMKTWQNCDWHGEPGSCFDNHCDTGHQVQLASSAYGAGQSCAPRLERSRVFCCDPANGKSPFLPVPLDYLFPNPPTGDSVDSDYDLVIDDTWGTGHDETSDKDDPDNAAFGFWVMTSPEEIQVSLDRRDGSHWTLFNCDDAISEEAQTIQMVCTNTGDNSNCHKIGLGHGVPGTIVEMPSGQGCGPAKYAVAVSMEVSKNQTLPRHLRKRGLSKHIPVVYDFTFDYDWMRVPRDLGDTQVRVDYSNEVGYWDSVVDKAARKKQKRSLDDLGGNHRRWLEDEWRDDNHFGALSTEEMHKRWFGSDVISWLQGLLNIEIKPTFTHDYEDSVTAIIMDESWTCKANAQTTLSASLNAKAVASIKVSSSFGMTIITKLSASQPLDLTDSFVFLKTSGEVSAIFTVDALAKVDFDSKEFPLATLPFPGASFTVPKLLQVGPKFVLNARAKGTVEVSAHLESRVEIANWDFQQTYPDANGDFDPKSLASPQREFSYDGLQAPTFDASVNANGQLTAYLMPTLSFGIEFDPRWSIGKCTAELVATGSVTLRARAGTDTPDCLLEYGVDAGALLTARATAPDNFHWNPKSFDFFPFTRNLIPGDGTDWKCVGSDAPSVKRAHVPSIGSGSNGSQAFVPDLVSQTPHMLQDRGATYGPFFRLPAFGQLCPSSGTGEEKDCNTITGYDDDQLTVEKRQVWSDELLLRALNLSDPSDLIDAGGSLWKRGGTESYDICKEDAVMIYKTPTYPDGTIYYDNNNWADCNDFGFGVQPGTQAGHDYIAEHILEVRMCHLGHCIDSHHSKLTTVPSRKRQMIQQFMLRLVQARGGAINRFPSLCKYIKNYWNGQRGYINGVRAWDVVASAYPSNDNGHGNEVVRIEDEVNKAKARVSVPNYLLYIATVSIRLTRAVVLGLQNRHRHQRRH